MAGSGRGQWQRMGARVLLASVAVVAIVLLLLLVPEWLVDFRGLGKGLSPADRVKAVTEERRSILALLAAAGAAATNYYTHQRQELDRDSNRTDRYTKAVEQLGHGSPHVQLGGIYALERIALDSVRDRGVISEVLSSFIREQTKLDPSAGETPVADAVPPSTVVGAALTVLARRPANDETYPPMNLAGADLTRVSLNKANLRGANLSGVRLRGGALIRVDLTDAFLMSADLSEVVFHEANLSDANLGDANLPGAHIAGSNFLNANLSRANLSRANFAAAKLTGSDLSHADLAAASLTGADLTGADLTGGYSESVGWSR